MGYRVGILQVRDAMRAYALIERVMPGLELEEWIALTATAALCRLWFVAKDVRGYIRGICHVAVRQGNARRQMEVPLIASVSLRDSEDVLGLLFAAVRELALAERCQTIHVWTAVPPDWRVLADYLDHGPWEHGLVYGADGAMRPDQSILPVKM